MKASNQWESRGKGFTKGKADRLRSIDHDTITRLEYGEKTWTVGQSVRDIMQNHLDANADRFYNEILQQVFLPEALEGEAAERESGMIQRFAYLLYYYKKYLDQVPPAVEEELRSELGRMSRFIKHLLRPEVIAADDGEQYSDVEINFDAIKGKIEELHEERPAVGFQVVDVTMQPARRQWVSYEEITQPPYTDTIEAANNTDHFRYQVQAIRIQDAGLGYDSQLTAIYKSTKSGQRHQRGRFGEGLKMSYLHLRRNHVGIKMRSLYRGQEADTKFKRAWQGRPVEVPVDAKSSRIHMRGVEIEMPEQVEAQEGSWTVFDLTKANAAYKATLLKEIDPRLSAAGLGKNVLDYSKQKFHYVFGKYLPDTPLGVSAELDPSQHYVQGILIDEANDRDQDSQSKPVFAYDILNSKVLLGRDRSGIKGGVPSGEIQHYWQHIDSPELLRICLQRCLQEGESRNTPPELYALKRLASLAMHKPDELRGVDARTRDLFLEVFPETIGLAMGQKNLIVSAYEASANNNRPALQTAERLGYHVVVVIRTFETDSIEALQAYYSGVDGTEVRNLETFQRLEAVSMVELPPENELRQQAEVVYGVARSELAGLFKTFGIAEQRLKIAPEPKYPTTLQLDQDKAVELQTQGTEHTLVVRPEKMAETGIQAKQEYWKRLMHVYILATLDHPEAFAGEADILRASQQNADKLHTLTSTAGLPQVDCVPDTFHHRLSANDIKEIDPLRDRLRNRETSLQQWQDLRLAQSHTATFAELSALRFSLSDLPENLRSAWLDITRDKIMIRDGRVGYFEQGTHGVVEFVQVELTNLAVVDRLPNDEAIYRLPGSTNRYVVALNIPEGAIVQNGTGDAAKQRCIKHRGEILFFGKNAALSRTVESFRSDVTISDGAMSAREISQLKSAMIDLHVLAPERGVNHEMKLLNGIVRSPVTVEYGQDAWNQASRFIQDIVQNHIDAAGGQAIGVHYEVLRDGQIEWRQGKEIAEDDVIVGLAFTDPGSGYTPNDIGTLGNSSKVSPFFAGKYGEGQKMVAAAAVRNGLRLSYSSVATHEGKRYRWQGVAGAEELSVQVKGRTRIDQRVVFNVNSSEQVEEPWYTSATYLQLAGPMDKEKLALWDKILEVVDPRKTDAAGNNGLERYVRALRRPDPEHEIDAGHVRILLNEPGHVYENGLLVSEGEDTLFGYDVPSITRTRERNAIDWARLSEYVNEQLRTCPDERYTDAIMRQLCLDELPHLQAEGSLRSRAMEYRLHSLPDQFRRPPVSLPHWDKAVDFWIGNRILHPKFSLEDMLRKGVIHLDMIADDYARRLPPEMRIDADSNTYDSLSNVIPTTRQMAGKIASRKIPAAPETLTELERVTITGAATVQQMLEHLTTQPELACVRNAILSSSEDDPAPDYVEKRVQETLQDLTVPERFRRKHGVFVAPREVGFYGTVSGGRIGLSELILGGDKISKGLVARVTGHELLHEVTGLGDYKIPFIMGLIELSRHNQRLVEAAAA